MNFEQVMMQKEWSKVWDSVDCLFTPTAPIVAPRIGESHVEIAGAPEDVRLASTRFVRAFNVLGWPAISIPLHSAGLPIGLQIVGAPFAETEVLSFAGAMEALPSL